MQLTPQQQALLDGAQRMMPTNLPENGTAAVEV